MKIMDKLRITKKGQIIIFIMIIFATLSLVIVFMLNFVNGAIYFYKRQISYKKKVYAAESGIQYTLDYLKDNRYEDINWEIKDVYDKNLSVYIYGDDENEEIILGDIGLEIIVFDPQYVDDALPENRKRPWESGYTPVANSSFTPEPVNDSDVRSIIYYVTCTSKTGQFDPTIHATIRKKIYSYIPEADESGEGTISFRRYREAKVLEIDY